MKALSRVTGVAFLVEANGGIDEEKEDDTDENPASPSAIP